MRLDFLVPGIAKCGTTTLCALLGEHPEIFMPLGKDYRFLDLDDYAVRESGYERRFAEIRRERCIGDGNIWYTDATTEVISRERILERYPDIKLIFMVRDPIDRIESAFRDLHHHGARLYGTRCPRGLEEALARIPNLVDGTSYGARIDNYRRYLRDDQWIVVFLEDLAAEPIPQLQRCFDFLGVSPDVEITDTKRRRNPGDMKCFDSDELVAIQRDPTLAASLRNIPPKVQDELFPQLGLRLPASGLAIEWTSAAVELVVGRIGADIESFLADRGRAADVFPRFQRARELGQC